MTSYPPMSIPPNMTVELCAESKAIAGLLRAVGVVVLLAQLVPDHSYIEPTLKVPLFPPKTTTWLPPLVKSWAMAQLTRALGSVVGACWAQVVPLYSQVSLRAVPVVSWPPKRITWLLTGSNARPSPLRA